MTAETESHALDLIEETSRSLERLNRVYYILDRDHGIRACSESLAQFLNVSRELLIGSHFNTLLGYFLQRVPKSIVEALQRRQAEAFAKGEIDKLPYFRDWVIVDNAALSGNPQQGIFAIDVIASQIVNDSDQHERLASVIEYIPHRVERESIVDFLRGVGQQEYADLLAEFFHDNNDVQMDRTKNAATLTATGSEHTTAGSDTIAMRDLEFTARLRAGHYPHLLPRPLEGLACTRSSDLDLMGTSIGYVSGMTGAEIRHRYGPALLPVVAGKESLEGDVGPLFTRWAKEQFVALCKSLGAEGDDILRDIMEPEEVSHERIEDAVSVLDSTKRYQSLAMDEKVAAAIIAIQELRDKP